MKVYFTGSCFYLKSKRALTLVGADGTTMEISADTLTEVRAADLAEPITLSDVGGLTLLGMYFAGGIQGLAVKMAGADIVSLINEAESLEGLGVEVMPSTSLWLDRAASASMKWLAVTNSTVGSVETLARHFPGLTHLHLAFDCLAGPLEALAALPLEALLLRGSSFKTGSHQLAVIDDGAYAYRG
ncbi:MAG: hypothetical protein LIO90_05925 [Bacteroidales bacterium]|nr:hypothetical protein [Bacteroidales bacterium]